MHARIRHAAGMRKALFLAVLLLSAVPVQAGVFYPESATLANGMRVVVIPNAMSDAVVQMLWIKAGSADEAHGGVAHYLEHLMFKGTDALPDGAFSTAIARHGGTDNAFTTHDFTAYHEVVAREHLGLVMQMEADRLRGLRLDPATATTELDVVRSERQERTDNSPQGLFEERMRGALFPSHAYGRPVIGTNADLATMSVQDAVAFYRAYYRPENAVLVLSGKVTLQDAVALAAGTFGRIPAEGGARSLALTDSKDKVAEARVVMRDARVKQPLWTRRYVVPSAGMNRLESLALEVLAEALDGGEVGLLYRHMVMETRKASAVDVDYDSDARGPSVLTFTATPAQGIALEDMEKELIGYLARLARRGLPRHEVEVAKQRMQDAAIFARDRLMAPAQIVGEVLATGGAIDDVERWPQRVRAVTSTQVDAALRHVLANKRVVTGQLLPAATMEDAP